MSERLAAVRLLRQLGLDALRYLVSKVDERFMARLRRPSVSTRRSRWPA